MVSGRSTRSSIGCAMRSSGCWAANSVPAAYDQRSQNLEMARKIGVEGLGQIVKPMVNGESQATVEAMPAPFSSGLASAFPPIAEYAFLSDCEVNALIAPSGRVEWMCLPRPDSPSVFAAILDRAAGAFRFAPSGVMVPAGRLDPPHTLVLEPSWLTHPGWPMVRQAQSARPRAHSPRRWGP